MIDFFKLIGACFTVCFITTIAFLCFISFNPKSSEVEFNKDLAIELGTKIQGLNKEIKQEKLIRKIAQLESNFDDKKWGDLNYKHKAYGIVQFQKRTFYWLAKKANFDGDWKNPKHQIHLLRWALNNNYGYLWSTYNDARKEIGI